MSLIPAKVGDSVTLPLVRKDGATGLFPRAKVYNALGALVFTSDMTHVADGVYYSDTPFIVATAGKFQVVYIIYTNAARTIEPDPPEHGEDFIVSDYSLIDPSSSSSSSSSGAGSGGLTAPTTSIRGGGGSSVRVSGTISNAVSAALEARGGWTWAWAGNDATPGAWFGLAGFGAAAANLVGRLPSVPNRDNYVEAPTGNINALGVGSARINQAVLIQDRDSAGYVRAAPSGFPGIPTGTAFTFRMILKPTFRSTGGGYFRLSTAASPTKRFELFYDKSFGVPATITAQLGNAGGNELVAVAAAEAYEDLWHLLDVVYLPEALTGLPQAELRMYLSGTLVASAVLGTGVLTNDNILPDAAVELTYDQGGGSDGYPQFDSFLFAGIAIGTALTHSEHRADADALKIRTDGLATAGIDWNRAYVGDQAADGTAGWPSFRPFGPPIDVAPILPVSLNTSDLILNGDTTPLQIEGLGRPRVNKSVTHPEDLGYATGAGLAVDLTKDFALRFILFTGPGPAASIYTQGTPNIVNNLIVINGGLATLGVTVEDFVVNAAIPGGPFPGDERIWYLIDINYGATDGVAGVSQLTVRINDVVTTADHTSALTSSFAGTMALLSNTNQGGNTNGGERLVFMGLLLDGLISANRHHIDAVALGVIAP